MTTLDALISGNDPTAVAYKAALESGNATAAAALAETLTANNPGLVFENAYVQPGAPNNVVVVADIPGVNDAPVT